MNTDSYPELSPFHPLIGQWFSSTFDQSTDVQKKAWKEISQRRHVLITAPTGSGKTLSAFLWAINTLLLEKIETGTSIDFLAPSVLYISPLKALNNDIQRNLELPLQGIQELAPEDSFPPIKIGIRSGDTSSGDREKQYRNPPDIFITTPESFHILLTSLRGRKLLSSVRTVILDEIHALANSKRGILLSTALARLEDMSPGFQRIGLSATVKPLDRMIDFIRPFNTDNSDYSDAGSGTSQKVALVKGDIKKKYELSINLGDEQSNSWWDRQVPIMVERIRRNRTSLVFANSRRAVEKFTQLANEYADEKLVYTHHGSLSKEWRQWVEQELKNGSIKAVAATSSLELGIDIGEVDEVLILQCPFSLSSVIQRIGRAGHGVGQVSKARFYPLHPEDILQALVATKACLESQMEEIKVPQDSLDVLAQVIISELAHGTRQRRELFEILRNSYTYHDLSEKSFNLVLSMLAGRYEKSRVEQLKPRILWDEETDILSAKDSSAKLIYSSGGTIPDRGYFDLRLSKSGEKIGELDEEFVFERSLGDRFTLGNRVWEIEAIDNQSVRVNPSKRASMMAPFWRAENLGRDDFFATKVMDFLEDLDRSLKEEGTIIPFIEDYCQINYQVNPGKIMPLNTGTEGILSYDPLVISELEKWLLMQREQSSEHLPHRHNVLIEKVIDPSFTPDTVQFMVHTGWGSMLNGPLSYAMAQHLESELDFRIQSIYNDQGIVLSLPLEFKDINIFEGLDSFTLDDLIKRKLEQSGLFGALFRENAARALLILRKGFNTRTPLWLNRQRSKRLFEVVHEYEDFPIIVETWRNIIDDLFDLQALKGRLDEIEDGTTNLTEISLHKSSPFAQSMLWQLTNEFMYAGDELGAHESSNVSTSIIEQMIKGEIVKPKIPVELIKEYNLKRRRLLAEYVPDSINDLEFWISEHRIITGTEYDLLKEISSNEVTEAMADVFQRSGQWEYFSDEDSDIDTDIDAQNRVVWFHKSIGPEQIQAFKLNENERLNLGEEKWAEIEQDLDMLLREFLTYYSFISLKYLISVFPSPMVKEIIDEMEANSQIVRDDVDGENSICLRENYESLLRIRRRWSRSNISAWSMDQFRAFLAWTNKINLRPLLAHGPQTATGSQVQQLHQRKHSPDEDIQIKQVERLLGFPFSPKIYLDEIIPLRTGYSDSEHLNSLLRERGIIWIGTESKKIFFCFEDEASWFRPMELRDDDESKEEAAENISDLNTKRMNVKDAAHRDDDPGSQSSPQKGLQGEKPGKMDLTTDNVLKLFPQAHIRIPFWQIHDQLKGSSAEKQEYLWREAWKGRLSCDNLSSLETGIQKSTAPQQRMSSRRASRRSWERTYNSMGNWFLLPELEREIEIDEEYDRLRIMADQLIERYGLLCREVLEKELGPFKWNRVLPLLRQMELAGELFGGQFVPELGGLQFLSVSAYQNWKNYLEKQSEAAHKDNNEISWYVLHSQDPLVLSKAEKHLERRSDTSQIIYAMKAENSKPIILWLKAGKELKILETVEQWNISLEILAAVIWSHAQSQFSIKKGKMNNLMINTIDDIEAADHELSSVLQKVGFRVEAKSLRIWKY